MSSTRGVRETYRELLREWGVGVSVSSDVGVVSPTTFIHFGAHFIHPRAVGVAAGVAAPQSSSLHRSVALLALSPKETRSFSFILGQATTTKVLAGSEKSKAAMEIKKKWK